ncbi:hypothetical protein FO519_002158 [Halicephalobus sp. NKZ332]|nr:hypothetical protein FO519_002158 [Halicephalobus sp. NKZ332]
MYRSDSLDQLTQGDKENFRTPSCTPSRKARSASASSGRMPMILPSNVKTVLRVRGGCNGVKVPFNIEKASNGKDGITIKGSKFEFDRVLGESALQSEVFQSVVSDAAEQCLRGFNFCVIAYGQTGSGKTHSISGTEEDPGILPKFCDELFLQIEKRKAMEDVYVSISFYEIYNEKVFDLLGKERKPLRIRGGDEVKVQDLVEVGASSRSELNDWRRFGLSRRATAATLINELSSRSHAVFQLTIRRELSRIIDGVEHKRIMVSHCFFVDLAGSEKLAVSGDQFHNETAHINRSLLALQRVVDARSSGLILATVSPMEKFQHETVATLRFASKASKIEQAPLQNEDKYTEKVSYLVAENAAYKHELQMLYAQLANLTAVVAVDRPQSPCLIELFEDDSLNRWTGLSDGVVINSVNEKAAIQVYLSDSSWLIKPITLGVTLNGKELQVDESISLKHADGVVIGGQKFLAAYFDALADPRTFTTYSAVKLQFVTEAFEIEKKKLIEEALEDLKKEESDVKVQMEQELKEMRAELESLRQKEKSAASSQKKVVTKEREEAEKMLLDVEEMHKNLATQVMKAETEFKSYQQTSLELEESKTLLMHLKSRVELLNGLLVKTGKAKSFIFRVQQVSQKYVVRIFNRKYKLYADIVDEEFSAVYDYFADVYQSEMTVDQMTHAVEGFLYGDRLRWKHARGVNAHTSSLFQTAVMNSLQETAMKRRSTIADISKTLNTRRSVLMDHVNDKNDVQGDSENEVVHFLSLYALDGKTSKEMPQLESPVAGLLDIALDAKDHFAVFTFKDNFVSANTTQKKAMSIIGMFRSIATVERFKLASAIYAKQEEFVNAGIDYLFNSVTTTDDKLARLLTRLEELQSVAQKYDDKLNSMTLTTINECVRGFAEFSKKAIKPPMCPRM